MAVVIIRNDFIDNGLLVIGGTMETDIDIAAGVQDTLYRDGFQRYGMLVTNALAAAMTSSELRKFSVML